MAVMCITATEGISSAQVKTHIIALFIVKDLAAVEPSSF